MKIQRQPDTTYIASCSFGKDSLATILLALQHGEPLDRCVFSEVMFSHEEGISGEVPEHIEWIRNHAIPRLEQMGVKVDVVRAERDYLTLFFEKYGNKSGHKGQYVGFPMSNMCVVNSRCKVRPMRDYYKQFGKIIAYVGIAADEPKRLARLEGKQGYEKISLMQKYGVTEAMAMQMCREADLLSPIYNTGTRGGCWFCPNCRVGTMRQFRHDHPELWYRLVELGKTPNLAGYHFNYDKTIDEIEARFAGEDLQLRLFDD